MMICVYPKPLSPRASVAAEGILKFSDSSYE